MRRTRQWYAALTKAERSELYQLERSRSVPNRLTVDSDDPQCPHCGGSHLGPWLCPRCKRRLREIIAKGNDGA